MIISDRLENCGFLKEEVDHINKLVLYIGNFGFPDKDASAQRVISNGFLLKELGFEVAYIGVNRDGRKNLTDCTAPIDYRGFRGWVLPYASNLSTFLRYGDQYRRIIDIVENHLDRNPDFVIFYGCPSLFILQSKLLRYFKRRLIPTISDVVDWMSASGRNFFAKALNYIHINARIRYLNAKSDGVIAISKYLYDYYKNKGKKVVLIPPLTSFEEVPIYEIARDKIRLIYTGQPFALDGRKLKANRSKDRLDLAIYYLHKLGHEDFNYVFDIYGITENQYLSVVPQHTNILKELNNRVRFHGSVSHELVLKEIANSDFLVLIRDDNRVTRAGFPTKLVESISCGTPVITTKTSNIADYIHDWETGVFLNLRDEEQSLCTIRKVLMMPKEEIIDMKKNCLDSDMFNYRRYRTYISDFLEKILN